MGVKSRGLRAFLLVLFGLLAGSLADYSFIKSWKVSTRIVQTKYGRLQGMLVPMDQHRYLKPIEVFLGVPYATPPVQSNRFSPTRTPSPWDGVRKSDKMGPACPQKLPNISNETAALEKMPKGRLEYLKRLLPLLRNQSEDCLYLNIFSPAQEMWDIVIWQEGKGDGMDYVPSSWGNDKGEYKWPKNCSRALLESLIDACDPLTNYKYKLHKALTKKSKIKSLTAAKEFCLKGLETSNLESNNNETTDSEHDASEDEQPLARFKRIATSTNGHLSTPQRSSQLTNFENLRADAGNLVYRKLCSIEFEIKESRRQMNCRIDNLEKKLFEHIRKPSGLIPAADGENVPLFLGDLPAKNDAEFISINKIIEENPNDMEELINSLYFCGGDNVHKAIYAQLKKVITKEVSLLYSGEGKKNKKSFVKLPIYGAITISGEARHPVIVYIHGESFEWNSANPYDGSVLASYADLVVITLNYRLGILGFLNANPAPHLKARVANYGLMDQIAALHWIQQNIALFGGDPTNVTLAGHGSGAACINFLMISPTVMPGLFHRALLLSGSALSSWALVEDPVNYAVKLAKEVNCTIPEDVGKDHEQIVDCLRETALSELLEAEVTPPAYLSAFGPSVDGVVIKADFAKELVTYFKPQDLQNMVGSMNANMKRSEATLMPKGSNPYDLLFGVVTSEALWRFSSNDIQAGFEGERRDKIIRTYVRNAYTYHLSEIFFTVVNEYTDWERTVQHPINTRDACVAALSDAQFVAPLVQTGDLLSAKPPQPGQEPTGPKTFFYVFDYQTKDGDYPQRMGTVHGEELPYLFGAPLVDGFSHFPKNYTRSELALSESFIIYVANFARTGNPNEHHKQDTILAASRERNRFRSIVWDEYDSVHQKYLEIGMKPRMKNHFRAHQLSVWLRLIPELHRAGMEDVVARHNLFRNHNSADLYDGAVRPDPLSRVSYYDPTMELVRKHPNATISTLEVTTTADSAAVTTCLSVVPTGFNPQVVYQGQANQTDSLASLEAAGYAAYSTALSVTIAIGCSLLILNVLIFAGVYYQRDKTRLEVKNLQQQQSRNQQTFETISKHQHYHLGQSSNIIVDVEQDTSAMIMAANAQQDYHAMNKMQQHFCPNAISKTLPKNATMQTYHHNQGSCMTLPKNVTLMNNTIAEMKQQHAAQPHNGNVPMPLNVPKPPPPPRAKSPENQPLLSTTGYTNSAKGNMRLPQAAMSEMRV